MWLLWLAIWSLHAVAAFRFLESTTLGRDPQTVNRLNGESFQQDPLVTLNGYQYAVFWTADPANASIRHASVSRRDLKSASSWETFTLPDYNQTDDDGHDVITLGISEGDGTLHIGFDQHDNDLRYRTSRVGVATNPSATKWDANIFGPTLDYLPGLESLDKSVYFINITYPRFLNIPSNARIAGADLLLELRVGRSGLGDDWLYTYTPHKGWSQIGRYLEGVNNNAYINGLDFDTRGVLHTTWTYRDYVNDTGQDVAVEAGPNGPENNHDMDYASSADLGTTWTNTWGQPIANCTAGAPILPNSPGITVFSIPKYGGILNQEAQAVDAAGRVHVLNRENTTGAERWYHYWRGTARAWTRTPLPPPAALPGAHNITGTPTPTGKRGKLVAAQDTLFAVLPSNAPGASAWAVLASTAGGRFADWRVVWEEATGCDAEPLFDRSRLEEGVLSLYLVDQGEVKVVDFAL
ncbi:BNR repeat-containing protein [Phanerochaete sordida]|uniref:BNR repeat-containing protein n=1 Tax=Phanerochaete sordida TaxID=48140 RepID=A0A9P3GH67_9APHY|nr:BNR repeat-containing protein [Phanerochaete sordida]